MKIDVLDHGFVRFIEAWGHGDAGPYGRRDYSQVPSVAMMNDYEVGIIEAARQSTQKAFQGWELDEKLLRYLYSNKHETPFEFAGMTIEVRAPIFVFREWHRHRTQSYNEMSARFAPLPNQCYLPDADDLYDRAMKAYSTRNKQEAGVSLLPPDEEALCRWLERQEEMYNLQELHYQQGLAIGVPKELARIGMPVGHYSQMRASGNLRNWLSFMTLRCDPKAQKEIRMFAGAVSEVIGTKFPRTHGLWSETQI